MRQVDEFSAQACFFLNPNKYPNHNVLVPKRSIFNGKVKGLRALLPREWRVVISVWLLREALYREKEYLGYISDWYIH